MNIKGGMSGVIFFIVAIVILILVVMWKNGAL